MCRLTGAILILVSSAVLAGPHAGGGAAHTAAAVSHAPARTAAVAPALQQPQYPLDARDGRGVHRDPSVNRMCTAQQRSGNKCLDRGWNVTVPSSAAAPRHDAP
jgi:hypothetical protein